MNILAVAIIADALIFHGTPANPDLIGTIPTTINQLGNGAIVINEPGQLVPTVVCPSGVGMMSTFGFFNRLTPEERADREACYKKYNYQDKNETCPKCKKNKHAMKNCSKCGHTGKVVVRKFRNPKTKQYTEKTDPKKSSFWKSWMKQHPEQEW